MKQALTSTEERKYIQLRELLGKDRLLQPRDLSRSEPDEDREKRLARRDRAQVIAHELLRSLVARGYHPIFSKYGLENQRISNWEASPDEERFFDHPHMIGDFEEWVRDNFETK